MEKAYDGYELDYAVTNPLFLQNEDYINLFHLTHLPMGDEAVILKV